ncbi:MAG: hypothetical protein JWM68_2353 [Verrucomicrobiales bacterium]|nr:hypothetical protein [Verrucomicrobiales bacterium]
MKSHLLKLFLVFGIAAFLAIFSGYYIVANDYVMVLYILAVIIGVSAALFSSYLALFSIGLLCPFVLPLPYVSRFPFLFFILTISLGRFIFQGWFRPSPERLKLVIFPIGVFFSWVLIRYCLNPNIPNLSGYGDSISGFRSYLNYLLCFLVFVAIGIFVRDRAGAVRLVSCLKNTCLFFALLLIALVFTKSMAVAAVLSWLGVSVQLFDNGFLRFVILPFFGTVLLGVSLLPRILSLSRFARVSIQLLAWIAILVSGTRSGVLMGLAMVCCIFFLKRRFARLGCLVSLAILSTVALHFVGEAFPTIGRIGFLRFVTLTSDRVAANSDAQDSITWRKLRWTRAIEDIKRSPVIGMGYGGLENAFVLRDYQQAQEEMVEIDVVSGGIHNGYLTSARALGIPGALLFIYIMLSQMFDNMRCSRRYEKSDPLMSDLHCLILANLVAFTLTIYIGTDVNVPLLWCFLGFGLLLQRIRKKEARALTPKSAAAACDFDAKVATAC